MSTVIQLLLDKQGFPNNHLPVLVIRQKAAFDIAAAIGGSFARGIRHQDISPFNTVVYQNRVFLTDWSAGRVSCHVASIALDVQCRMIADSPLHCIEITD